MKIVDSIRADYRQNKVLFWLKFLIIFFIIYCAIRSLLILIADFRGDTSASVGITLLTFYIFFFSGILDVIRLYQISFDTNAVKFKPLRTNIMANFALSALLLFTYLVSAAVK